MQRGKSSDGATEGVAREHHLLAPYLIQQHLHCY
jgi:hypothetical protein